MNILLVNPTTSYQAGFRKYAVFPYGILFLAAVLEKAGHNVTIYDNNIDSRKPEDFVSVNANLIGFSVLTGRSIGNAIDQSKVFKEIFPRASIVWGGVHPSLMPEQTVAEPFIDYVVVGEGEYTLLELVNHLEEGKPGLHSIQGLVFKQGDIIIKNDPRPFIKNLNELPDPAWHLVDIKQYSAITLNTSRGCPFRCTFCYNQTFNKGRRADFSAEKKPSHKGF
jgi:anaerobic magnesium-protoporphyrin IX monomethyl ester cyclase